MAINAEKIEVEPSLGYISINGTKATSSNGSSCSNGEIAVCSPQDLSTPSRVSEKKRLCYQRAEIAVLCFVVVIVWMLLSLPILFYHLPDSQPGQTLTCASETYTGDVCRDVLQSQQDCLPDRVGSSDVYISLPDGDNQDDIEIRARTLVRFGLPRVGTSPECQEAVVPFLCLFLYPLCDSEGTLYRPSSMDCVTISTGVCEREWMEAVNLLGPGVLPQCESLPSTSLMCENVTTEGSITTDTGNITRESSTNTSDNCDLESLECRDGFYINECSCQPRCDTWETYPHSTIVVIDVFVVLSAAIGFIAGVAVLVISCIRWKRMFVFPSVFTVYLTISLLVFASIVLISYTDRSELYCTSLDLQQSVRNTSTFCTISALFWKIKFPFSARVAESTRNIKFIHLTMILLGFVLPLVPVIATVETTGFVLSRFPAILCVGSNANATFYSLVLPIIVLLQIGIAMLIIVFWIMHKQHGLFKIKPSKGPFKIDTAERKLLIVFCYYVILGVIALTAFTLTTKKAERVVEEVSGYFECELPGIDPENPCDRSRFEALLHPVLTSLSYILLGMFPAINLIFAVNVKELKQWCGPTRLFHHISSTGALQSTTSASAATASTERNHSVDA